MKKCANGNFKILLTQIYEILDQPRNFSRPDGLVGFIIGIHHKLSIITEHSPIRAFERKAVQHRQLIGENRRPEPLNDIAVIIVVGEWARTRR